MTKKNPRFRGLSPENVPQPVVLAPATIARAAGGDDAVILQEMHELAMSSIRHIKG
jgi:hypothetical protein